MTTSQRVGLCFGILSGASAVLVALLVFAGTARAGQDDPFGAKYKAQAAATDPFSEQYKAADVEAVPPRAVQAPAAQAKESLLTKKLAELVTFDVRVEPAQAKAGDIVRLTVMGKLQPGFHTYPITQRTPDQGQLSTIDYELPAGLKALWPLAESKPVFKKESIGKRSEVYLEHEHSFTWSQDLLVQPGAKPGPARLGIRITLEVCDSKGCYGPAPYRPLEATLEVKEGGVSTLSPKLRQRLAAPEPAVRVVAVPAGLPATKDGPRRGAGGASGNANAGDPPVQGGDADGNQTSLLALLGFAFFGAFLMLLTPCVFPMIPITVNFFLKQSEKEHHRPLLTACVYSGTIIILLTLVMLVLGNVVVTLANDAWFNLALGAVLVFFALSLFGMYEIELPSGLARFTSAREGKGGYVGAVFMALTFTITSFTCTGPFLGALLAPVAHKQPPFAHLFLAALVYSATFAAPFFVLALFPSLLKRLPKSGGWLNAVKVTMGFLELGAALKFLANTDLAWSPGNPRLFNFDTVLCAWVALSVLAGLYLIGVFRLPHDDAVEHIGVLRMLFACLFFGLALYMTPALWGQRLHGVVGENIVAFLPPQLAVAGNDGRAAGGDGAKLAWHLSYQDAWREAKRDNKLIFIDFTGVFCTNCRDNEENVFTQSRVRSLLSRYARVQLYTDTVPDPKLSAADAKGQANRNSDWRAALVQDVTNPYYVILRPDPGQPFKDGRPNGQVLAGRKGKIFDVDDFVQFLEQPDRQAVLTARRD
jgi:thiol:disulfide interchange protein DsbD